MAKTWNKIVMEHGIKIRLFQHPSSGMIYRDVALGRVESASGKVRTEHDVQSLKHSDRKLAESQAREIAARIAEDRLTGRTTGKLTLGQLFAAYRQHRLPKLKPTRQREAEARMAMFSEAWGRDLNVLDIDQTRVDTYCNARRSLKVVPPVFRPGPDGKFRRGYRTPKPVRDGALDGEFRFLAAVLNWAVGFKTNGGRLLAENPLKGVERPKESNVRRPVASHQRFVATLEHTDAVDPMGRLRCILTLARHTGRREGALCAIRAHDLLLSNDRIRAAVAQAGMDEREAEHMPNGAIRWAAENDKQGLLFISPISQAARAALDGYLEKNPRIGDVPLFPAPGPRPKKDAPLRQRPEVPIPRETAMKWLVKAEKLAGLPKIVGGVFHPYRRLWATERKHLPDMDVAATGGWKDTQALRLSYQHADPATALRVVELA